MYYGLSVAENMLIGAGDQEQMMIYCEQLGLVDDILNLPDGWDTIIDKNSQLSTGQKKKIHIIRSLLRNTAIYLWDEPTANLDDKTKKSFWKMIEYTHENKMNIIVSHDTCLCPDKRVVDFGGL